MTSSLNNRRLLALRDRLLHDVDAGIIPGATVVVGHHDQVVLECTVGYRDVTAGDPLRSDAIWRIYSMTKPVVTLAALRLAEAGLLRLDQPVAEFLPGFNHLRVANGDNDATDPARAHPTIQDLMRHTAGLAYGYMGEGPARQALLSDGLLTEDLDLAGFVARLGQLPLAYQPGTMWHYSHATEVLGRIIEVVTGKDLQSALVEHLLSPLRMDETRFQLPSTQRDRVAQPLPQSSGGRPAFFDPCVPIRRQSAGGGLVSTVADYSRFLQMLLNHGELEGRRVLSPAMLRLALADHLGPDIGHAPYYPPGPGYGFGLGFAVRLAEGIAAYPGSRGDCFWSGVGGTYFWIDPSHDLFALLMLQLSSVEQRLHYRMLTRGMVYAALDT